MSTPPSKSQSNGPRHNSSLGDLKWSSSHPRGQRVGESSSEQSPASDAAQRPITLRVLIGGVPVSQYVPSKTGRPSASNKADKAISSASSDCVAENASAAEDMGEKSLSKKPTRLLMKMKPIEVPPIEVPQEKEDNEVVEEIDKEDPNPNTWNLRPRQKPQGKTLLGDKAAVPPIEVPQEEGDEIEEEDSNTRNLRPRKPQGKPSASHPVSKVDGETLPDNKAALPPAAENVGGSKDLPKKLKLPKFSLTLTPQEIEEDIFALTGRRPSRKPIRRPEAVQKQVDNLFPGMRLGSVTPKDYKVPEASKKKKK